MTKFLSDEKYSQIQQYLRRLSTACQWFNPEIDHDYIKMVWSVMSRLNESNQSITWEKIIKNYRERYLPSEKYLKEMVGMLINDVLAARHREPYEKLTDQEREESKIAAREACHKVTRELDMIYGVQEEKSKVKVRNARIRENVKKGLVEVIDIAYAAERLRNGPIWIPESEAKDKGIAYKDHRSKIVGEMKQLGRVGTSKVLGDFRK